MKQRRMMHSVSSRSAHLPKKTAGFSLIELMISLLLGLIVVAGVVSVFLANQQTYRTNEALGDVQDGTRTAFELMAQDIRNAGLTGCDSSSSGNITNVLAASPGGGGTIWWANWNNALHGFGTGTAADTAPVTTLAVAGNDSLELIGAANPGLSVLNHKTSTTTFVLNEISPDLATGDAMIVCDPQYTAIFQATSVTPGTMKVVYSTTGTLYPGNYSNILATTGIPYTFGANALVAKLYAVDWYIGNTPGVPGSFSLFRVQLVTTATGLGTSSTEMVRNVSGMSIAYLQSGNAAFKAASFITNWSAVTAVQVTLTVKSTNQYAGTDNKPITRPFTATTTVRNRVN